METSDRLATIEMPGSLIVNRSSSSAPFADTAAYEFCVSALGWNFLHPILKGR